MTAWREVIEPVDSVHYDCMAARAAIKREFDHVKAQVVTWRPREMPADFGQHDVCRRR